MRQRSYERSSENMTYYSTAVKQRLSERGPQQIHRKCSHFQEPVFGHGQLFAVYFVERLSTIKKNIQRG